MFIRLHVWFQCLPKKNHDISGNGTAPVGYKNIFSVIGKHKQLKSNFTFVTPTYITFKHEPATDLYIKPKLLEHNDSRTTIRYTHVSKRVIQRVQSSLVTLVKLKNAQDFAGR